MAIFVGVWAIGVERGLAGLDKGECSDGCSSVNGRSRRKMNIVSKILLAVSIISFVIGLGTQQQPMVSGFAFAMGAVMFALSFITLLVHKAETTH